MSECKRLGCKQEAMGYPSYGECCSLYCRDVHEQDVEIETLRTRCGLAESDNKRLRMLLSDAIDLIEHAAGKGKYVAELSIMRPYTLEALEAKDE